MLAFWSPASVTSRVASSDVIGAITARSANHDLTVIGATREGMLQQAVFGAIPEEVGEQVENTVILTKRYLAITSRLRRWFRWK